MIEEIKKQLEKTKCWSAKFEDELGVSCPKIYEEHVAYLLEHLERAEAPIRKGLDCIEQIHDQKRIWPGEVDDFEDAAKAYFEGERG